MKKCSNEVGFYGNLVHVLPVVPSRKREKGFIRTIAVSWGRFSFITIRARETLNVVDLLTMLSVVKIFDRMRKQWWDAGELRAEDGTTIRDLVGITTSMYRICQVRGLPPTTKNRRNIKNSLWRLEDCVWTLHRSHGKTTNIRIIYDTEIGSKMVKIRANKQFIEKCLSDEALLISLTLIQRCKTDIGKLLVYWLEGQKSAKSFNEDILISALHLCEYTSKRKARQTLREAFQDAKESGYLAWWETEKRSEGNFYLFGRAREIGYQRVRFRVPAGTF